MERPSDEGRSAETSYWIAVVRPNDPWKSTANAARKIVEGALILTTDEVLTEFLAALSRGDALRRQAAKMVRAILANPGVSVTPQSHESFLHALDLYEKRLDKEYSLTDCASMSVMSGLRNLRSYQRPPL